jgi:hypothetical protein
MNIPGNADNLEHFDGEQAEERDNKWNTIRYAIRDWGTTVRLLTVLLVLLGPAYLAYLIVWLTHG